jgi:hypothetical protein
VADVDRDGGLVAIIRGVLVLVLVLALVLVLVLFPFPLPAALPFAILENGRATSAWHSGVVSAGTHFRAKNTFGKTCRLLLLVS